MTYAFLKSVYGTDDLDGIMNTIEYAPHTDPHWDPFSVVYDVSTSLCCYDDNVLIIYRSLARTRTRLCWTALVQSALATIHQVIHWLIWSRPVNKIIRSCQIFISRYRDCFFIVSPDDILLICPYYCL